MPGGDDVRRLRQHRPRRLHPHHPPGHRRRHQLHRHGGRLLLRRVGGDRRQGAGPGQAAPDRPGHQGARDHGEGPQRAGQLAPLDHDRVRPQPDPARHRLHRPLPNPPAVARHRHRRDARRADRSGARRQDPLLRQLHLPGPRDRRGAVGGRAAGPGALRHRAAAVLDPRAQHREGRAPHVREVRHGRAVVEPPGGRVALGRVRPGQGEHEPPRRRAAAPLRHGAAGQPGQARGRDQADRGGGRRRPPSDSAGARLRARPPGGDVAHHRAAHHGAPGVAATGARAAAELRRARPDRRHRRAGHRPERAGRRLGSGRHRRRLVAPAGALRSGAGRPERPDARRGMEPIPARDASEVRFDETVDVVVVGLGVAGASAVVAARQAGADVLAVERGAGPGGTSAHSGGLIYLGGGTALQSACGFTDSPENMATFLRAALGPGVDDDRVDAYCEGSPEHFDWLVSVGVPFRAAFCDEPNRESADDAGLLFSGGEDSLPVRRDRGPGAARPQAAVRRLGRRLPHGTPRCRRVDQRRPRGGRRPGRGAGRRRRGGRRGATCGPTTAPGPSGPVAA